ncbi:LysR family transcriptional regulator [Verminephrobacter aporrectodeae subsp. tuberculatae]|uniref:LysR family transcriptional regulator n=1 Tax=Verminephrobacter aporrectodeae TaxID=1110389 RepID=UPI0022433F69|nr:LysR family transcriptional regulator [Verminephrobacter aporrectodeae]MCW8205867.1 LysR family transcriptional regulator [Verminephrobacter aporrectodeae subsp. tuberculatae]
MSKEPCWDDIRVFLTYLRNGSIANAADALRISAPTVSRRINALQKTLGFPLLHRFSHGFELTESAQELVKIWQDAERLLMNAPKLVDRMYNTQNIELRFSTTPALATALIFPNIHAYIARWPSVMLDINTSVRLLDIGAGQADMALRFVEPERGTVIRQRIGTASFNVYGAEALFPDGFQVARDWSTLSATGLRAINWSPGTGVSMPQQKLREVLGAHRSEIAITEFSGLVEGIRNGIGAGILPDMVGRHLPGVRAVMAPGMVGDMPLWLVMAERLAGYRHVLEFRDFVREAVDRESKALSQYASD